MKETFEFSKHVNRVAEDEKIVHILSVHQSVTIRFSQIDTGISRNRLKIKLFKSSLYVVKPGFGTFP